MYEEINFGNIPQFCLTFFFTKQLTKNIIGKYNLLQKTSLLQCHTFPQYHTFFHSNSEFHSFRYGIIVFCFYSTMVQSTKAINLNCFCLNMYHSFSFINQSLLILVIYHVFFIRKLLFKSSRYSTIVFSIVQQFCPQNHKFSIANQSSIVP